jgi:hypothetical protein
MPDFNNSQAQLGAARAALNQAQIAALEAAEKARQAQSALDSAKRQENANDRAALAKIQQLSAAANAAQAASQASRDALGNARASLADATAQFAAFSDPRRAMELLDNTTPFLLFPVRIETRFRTTAPIDRPGIAVAPPQHQLLVRIYPDDCSIDTFEPLPSANEWTNVQNYWMNYFRAGGIENDQLGAWSNLVATNGSGRAGWLVDNFQPVNLASAPAKAKASDEILVIPTNAPLGAADASAISAYWEAYWLADGDAAKQQTALSTLNAAVGAARAANLIANYVPFNLADKPTPPLTKSDVALSTAFVIFPATPPSTSQSWAQAPQVRQFPDRFIVLGFNNEVQTLEALGGPVKLPLYTGPDPSVDVKTHPNDAIHPNGPDLYVPPELQWMVDFDAAVAAGMGIAIDLTPGQMRAGFDRLLVIGLQLSVTADKGPAALQEMLTHHKNGRSGLELIAQGTPAHNSTGRDSGYTSVDDPKASFDDRKNSPLFTVTADPNQKRDGQWLAEFLAIDPAFVATVHNSGGKDQQQARAMQRALWPASLGYWMNTLFTPNPGTTSIFSDAAIGETRSFFTQYVSGRGAVPAIRIGHQPYGILPVTAFSKIQWFQSQPERLAFTSLTFQSKLYSILSQIDSDWGSMSKEAAWVGAAGDPHQTLLNLLALHPSSVEYYSRTAESAAQLFNMLNFWALAPDWWQAILQLALQAGAIGLLQRLGYSGSELPDLLNHFFLTDSPQITTIIDDVPLSEITPIRAYTDSGHNYIQWLIDAASTSLETLRAESGFTNGKSPTALLYLYLRHALLLGYYDSSYNYHRDNNVLDATGLRAMRVEPNFIHIAEAPGTSESRYAALYKTESRITGNPTLRVSDFITSKIGFALQTAGLADQLDALKTLATASTAELERLFAEHIDTCSYRYDAWLLGLVNQHVMNLRAAGQRGNGQQSGSGLFLGAYAWVENLAAAAPLVPAQVPQPLQDSFPGSTLWNDNGEGYIHAPSIPHANTAAVLRSGYMASAGSGTAETLAVNLSSDRVRVALSLMEGIRNGQSLGALLGYNFEVGLHDDYVFAEVDSFIFPLRKAFPLVADSLLPTKTDPNVPIEAIEARNVLDGKKLLDRVQQSSIKSYPYGLSGLPAANPDQQTALDAQTQALLNSYDALADLALAESVFQATQGNYSRVASTIDAYSTGNFPPEPAVIQTPPAGIGLTHRIGLHLKTGLSAPATATPRVQAEPAINDWLDGMLPPLAKIACTVTWTDPVTHLLATHVITMQDLAVEPIELLSLVKPDNVQAMVEMDDRVLRFVFATWAPRPDAQLQIQYVAPGAGQFSLFETTPLLRTLRTLLTQSRPLRATDVVRSNDASASSNTVFFTDKSRITNPFGALQTLSTDMASFLSTLMPLLNAPINVASVLAAVDANLEKAVTLLERAARFNMPQSGWGFIYAWQQSGFADLLAKVNVLIKRWNQKLIDFNNALAAYAALPAGTSDAERFAALQAAEQIVSSQLDPLPATPAALLVTVQAKGLAFQTRLGQFQAILGTADPSFANLLGAITPLSVSEFDSQPFDVTAFPQRAVIVTQDLARIVGLQSAALQSRIATVSKQLTAYDAASSDADKVKAFQTAAKTIFGDDFQTVPEFVVSAAQAGEWTNAYNASLAGNLFTYLKGTLNIDFPVDEWMYGAARVRPMLRTWESALMLATAFGITAPPLTPIQLPYEAAASWVALPYPSTYTIDSDRLLYTALYQPGFDATTHQCGLLLDEWTEVIPADTRDTAVTFQYSRPDNEPPQAMLLVTSPQNPGAWQWPDLVAAINETLDLAKKRAVEPAQIDPTIYSRFLPATVMANTTRAITIATTITAAAGAIQNLQGNLNA